MDENLDIKITDFGLSNIMSPGKKFSTFCGSLHYACPEILRGEEYVGPGADIWAMGVILYCLVTGSQPWSAPTSEDILQQIMLEGLQIPAWLTPECTDLIVQMLRLKEKDRITLAEMRKHPWVLKDYAEPPPTHLPDVSPVSEIDEFVMTQVKAIGFEGTAEERDMIMRGEQSQVVVTYNLLLKKRKEEIEAERKRKESEEQALREALALREAVAAANAQLSVTDISMGGSSGGGRHRGGSVLAEALGRARANSTFVQPYLPEEIGDYYDEDANHVRERSGSEPPVFSEDPVRLAALAAEAEDAQLHSLMASPTKSKKSSGRIKVKTAATVTSGGTTTAASPNSGGTSSSTSSTSSSSRSRNVPALALDAVREEDESSGKKKTKKKKVSARSSSSSSSAQNPDSAGVSPLPSPKSDTPSEGDYGEDTVLHHNVNGTTNPDGSPASAAVPSNKVTKRPVLKLEDIPKIREAQGDKVKHKPHHHMVSPRRRAHQVEKKSVQEVFAETASTSSATSSTAATTGGSSSSEGPSSSVPEQVEVNAALFGCSTTSTLSVNEIHRHILIVLTDMKGVIIKSSTSTSFRCVYTDVSFKIEIVSIAKFDHLRGIKMSRVTGDLWKYKEIAAKVIAKLKL